MNYLSVTKKKNESYIKMAVEQINYLKRMKINLLNNKLFPEALKELKKESQDHPGYDEIIHEEFINDIKKSIQEYDPKSDKKI